MTVPIVGAFLASAPELNQCGVAVFFVLNFLLGPTNHFKLRFHFD